MRRRGLLLLVGLTLAGCQLGEGPRQLPFPTLEPTALYVELQGQGRGAARRSASPTEPQSDFQRALAGAPTRETGRAVQSQQVLLSGQLVGEIPKTFNEWRWAADSTSTLFVHQPAGGAPDALVYTEAFSKLRDRLPSMELQRFQLSVDPDLTIAPKLVQHAINPWGDLEGNPEDDSRRALTKVVLALATRTQGAGLGYESTPETFTGWRWVGRNAHRAKFRLGRSAGTWGTPDIADAETLEALDTLAARFPQAQKLMDRMVLEVQSRGPALVQIPRRNSTLIIGTASIDYARSLHLAMVCTSPCGVARDLAAFVGSVRQPSSEERIRLAAQNNPAELTKLSSDLGLSLSSASANAVGDDLAELMRAVIEDDGPKQPDQEDPDDAPVVEPEAQNPRAD